MGLNVSKMFFGGSSIFSENCWERSELQSILHIQFYSFRSQTPHLSGFVIYSLRKIRPLGFLYWRIVTLVEILYITVVMESYLGGQEMQVFPMHFVLNVKEFLPAKLFVSNALL